jgi:hypothetical protein
MPSGGSRATLNSPEASGISSSPVTSTVTVPEPVVMNPGIVAETMVEPAVSGSNSMPPAARVVGELD